MPSHAADLETTMFRTSASILPFLLLLIAPARPLVAQASPPPLVLRPGDALRVLVRDEPTLSGEFAITAAGDVLLPEAGLVRAAGRPFPELEAAVRTAYSRQVVDPQVLVIPLARVAVLGEVRAPGLFRVDPTETMADLLAAAGGLTPAGNARAITLLRAGARTRFHLDPGEPALGGRVLPGDQLMVGRRGWLSENTPVLVGATASVLAAAVTAFLVR